jgi:amino acid adenylation domain-containing protein
MNKLIAVDFDPFADGELLLTAPATASQTEIWLSVQMGDGANCAYNLSQSFRLTGKLDKLALESALQQLVQRHEALRTTFNEHGDTICIVAELPIDIPSIDLADLSPPERELRLAQIVKQDVNQPFNIEQGPLFKAQIIKLHSEEHLLLLNAHHIVCDGWSWAILIEDLSMLYSAAVRGITPDLPVAEKFSEYAIAQLAESQQQEAIETERYWLAQFSDSVPIVDFPTDRPRPPLRTFNSAREDWELAPELGDRLKQLGTKFGCSFATTILAGFEVWLHRLTGQTDLVVGIPSSGQVTSGRDRLVGHCVNLLPLRTQIDGKTSFSDYLQIRRSTILDAYDRQQFTFGSLVSKLALPRDASRIPLVPIIFNLDRDRVSDSLSFTGLELTSVANPRAFENFELFVNAVELGDQIVLECQYNTNLFDADTIRRRMGEFEVLLLGIVANPDRSIGELPLLTDSQRQKLLGEWNQTQVDYPHRCIHQLFEAQVERTPDRIAVVFEDRQLTYRELNNRANQLAHYLRARGVGKDVLVGLYLDRSLEMVVGIWGILKAGGAYLPLDPTYPQDRVAYILADAGVKVTIGDARLLASLPEDRSLLVSLDTNWSEIERQPQSNPVTDTQPDNLAYVIYTSGSTGKPKGVEVCHLTQANLLDHLQHSPGLITSADTLLAVTTICFDTSTVDLYLPLVVGAKIVLVSSEVATNGFELLATLIDAQATFIQATPASFWLLLAAGWEGSPNLKVVSSGEALPRNLADILLGKVAELWNFYGPTETTVWSTGSKINDLRQSSNYRGAIELIGKPISNNQVYILDRYLQPLPIGVMGELYIGGDCLAKGYLNRPDLTSQKFITNPFSDLPDARLYQTGDLARYLPDGNIEYLGRIDNQVKIRGFRIELGEIEASLVKHPAVKAVAVIVREDVPGDCRLVAYLVVDRSEPPTVNSLRELLASQLPSYMIPATFVFRDALPLTPNGKIDRRALTALNLASTQIDANFVAPINPTQAILASIWSQVLRVDRIGIHDNFFDLGGHSLLATQVISRFRQEFSIEIPLQSLFEQPTIASLSDRIATLLWIEESRQTSSSVATTEMEEFEI